MSLAGSQDSPAVRGEAIPRRALAALFTAQALSTGAITVSTSLSSIIAARLGGSESVAGLPATINMLASAVAAGAAGRLMAARGRRFGLQAGYLLATFGSALAATMAILGSLPGFLLGSALVGVARGGIDQGRYAAVELVPPAARGRTLGIFLSGSVIGAVFAAALTPWLRAAAAQLGVPEIEAGWYMASALLLSGLFLTGLYPRGGDRHEAPAGNAPVAISLVPASRHPAMAAMAAAHGVMVMLMVLMPLHARHLGHGLPTISSLLTGHLAGMYAFAWLIGGLADRIGHRWTIAAGGVILVVSAYLAAVENTALGMGVALFLLGLGWSFCYLSASALLASGSTLAERARVQGTADLINWTVAAVGAMGGGILVGRSGFPSVAAVGAVASLVPLVSAAWLSRHGARG